MSPHESNKRNADDEVVARAGEEEEEEDEVDEELVHPQRGRKRVKLFIESGLTDQERRALRQNQREIAQTLRAGDLAEDIAELERVRNANNNMFHEQVKFTREAVLDADNLDLIAANYAQHVEKQVTVPRFDAVKLVQKLTSKCVGRSSESTYFNWKALGIESAVLFNSLPSRVTFLAGALDSELEARKKAARKPREKVTEEEAEEVKPENVQNSNKQGDADKLSAMEKNYKVLKQKLKERTKELRQQHPNLGQHPDIDGIRFLVNPKSFTQTVENIFNLGFSVKKGEVEIGVRERGLTPEGQLNSGLYIRYRGAVAAEQMQHVQATQAVCAFTMADWRRMCQARGHEDCDLGHRKGGGSTSQATVAASH